MQDDSNTDDSLVELSTHLSSLHLQPKHPRLTSHCRFRAGELIQYGKYQIIEPLGSRGRFATVWKATSLDSQKNVALKVYRTGETNAMYYDNEVKIYHKILKHAIETQTGMANIMRYNRTFAHVTIGHDLAPRVHPIVELQLLGDNVGELLQDCVEEYNEGLAISVVKRITKQVFTGLSYLHKCGIIHTDIKPDNLMLTRPLSEINSPEDIEVVIGDLGSAIVDNEFRYTVGTTQYLAPELVLDLKYDSAIDIWAAFTVCYQLFTGDLLFDVYNECGISYSKELLEMSSESESDSFESMEESDSSGDDSGEENEQITFYNLLLLMEKVLGPIPKRWAREYGRAYYNSKGKLKNNPQVEHISISGILNTNYDLDPSDGKPFEDFLLFGLKYLPEERPTADQVLQHPWLN